MRDIAMLKTVRVYETDDTCVEFADIRWVERLASGQVRLNSASDANEPEGAVRGVTCRLKRRTT
jgi:hypothetical protein